MEKTNNKKTTIAYIFSFLTIFTFLFSQYVSNGVIGEIALKMDSARVKYILLFITCILNIVALTSKNGNSKLFPNGKFRFEFNHYFKAIAFMAVMTLIYQIFNGFKAFAISEILYLITPLFFVALLVSVDSYNITRMINALFYAIIIIFIMQNISNLSIQSIMSISFFDSYSPFESGLSGMMVIFTLFFLVNGEKRKSIICAVISYITLKRISVLINIALIVFWPILQRISKNKKIVGMVTKIAIIVFILLPIGLEFFYSDTMATIISNKFQTDMNQLTMDRYRRTRLVLDNREHIVYGLGSTTDYITKYLSNGSDLENRNLHSDILRLYLECTILGSIVVTYCYFKSTRNNLFSFILILNAFMDLIFNHNFLGAGNAGLWCILYMVIFYLNNMEKIDFYKNKSVKG